MTEKTNILSVSFVIEKLSMSKLANSVFISYCFHLQMSIIFIDAEGESIQELSAIQISAMTRQILDVYHAHAAPDNSDDWSRHHIHGLNINFLKLTGFPSEDELIKNFRQWLAGKNILTMYGNDPRKERTALNLTIHHMDRPVWTDRVQTSCYQTALAFKKNFVPILNKRCCHTAHSYYWCYPIQRNSQTEFAKSAHGFHCSLYDCFELYLDYVTE